MARPTYARRTEVPATRTRMEIEHELEKRGASQFGYNRDGHSAVLAFTLQGLAVRMALKLPASDDRDITHTPAGAQRSATARAEALDAEARRRWRALFLVVKAKLVAVDEGITSLEREFLSDVVLPSGATVLEQMRPDIEIARAALLEIEG